MELVCAKLKGYGKTTKIRDCWISEPKTRKTVYQYQTKHPICVLHKAQVTVWLNAQNEVPIFYKGQACRGAQDRPFDEVYPELFDKLTSSSLRFAQHRQDRPWVRVY